MKPFSYIQLQKKYGDKFIAIYKGKVIASAKTAKRVIKQVEDKVGNKNLILQYVAPLDAACVYRVPSFTALPCYT